MTFLPIVERELREAARRPVTHRTRLAAAGVIFLTWACLAVFNERGLTPPQLGSQLFGAMAFFTMGFSLFAGVFAAADSLSEERREGTLGLLFLTDLTGADVVLGKLVASSLNMVYALMATFPVLALPMLMGGLKPGEFWRAVLVLLATIFLSISSSMMVSAFCREARAAMFGAAGIMVFLGGVLPLLGKLAGLVFRGTVWGDIFFWPSPVMAFWKAYEASYVRQKGPAEFWTAWGVLIGLSLICLVIASIWLPRAWQERETTSSSGWWRERWRRLRFPAPAGSALARAYALSHNPFAWLTTRDQLPRILARLLFCSLLPIWLGFYAVVLPQKSLPPYASVCFLGAIIIHLLFKCLVAVESTRRLVEDRQSGALELLLVTPLSEEAIVRGHVQGLRAHFRNFMVVLVLMNLALLILVATFSQNFGGDAHGWIYLMIIGGAVVLCFDFRAIAWVGLQQALRAKKQSRALLATLGRVLGIPWLAMMVIFLTAMSGGMRRPEPLFFSWTVGSCFSAWAFMSFARSEVRDGIRRRIRGGAPDVVFKDRFFPSGLAGRVLKQAE
jgi:ABC-type transport system involved in cytochrome c biogenesis permease component